MSKWSSEDLYKWMAIIDEGRVAARSWEPSGSPHSASSISGPTFSSVTSPARRPYASLLRCYTQLDLLLNLRQTIFLSFAANQAENWILLDAKTSRFTSSAHFPNPTCCNLENCTLQRAVLTLSLLAGGTGQSSATISAWSFPKHAGSS